MMSTYSVAKLNNRAIALFRRGCFDEAVVSLTVAINHLLGCMQDNQPRNQKENIALHDSNNATQCKMALPPDRDTLPKNATCWSGMLHPISVDHPTANTSEARMESSMYSRALILSENSQDSSSEYYMTRASVCMLYNLAFLHHWRSVHLGMSSGMFKALEMYCKILKTFHSRRNNPPDIEIVVLAIWNNMGHIYSQLFQVDEARTCFHQLRQLLSSRTDLHFWIPDPDYEVFVVSALFQGNSLHLAPAA